MFPPKPRCMNRQAVLAVGLAALLALAGCAGSTTPGAPGGGDAPAGSSDDGTATGTVQFYVSDQPAAIDDFEHLNVTISRVAFQRADGGAENEDDTATATGAPNATATNTTVTPTATPEAETEAPENETEAETEDDEGADGAEMDDERAGWETVEVDSRTVDLTRLRGDNATLVGTPSIPAGNYTKVAVFVESINATLATGESVNVKLPSERLQLNKGFTLEPNGTVQFVYDISVVKAGNSGKYILKPVISESGADQPIREVGGESGADGERPEDAGSGADETESDDEAETDDAEATDAEADGAETDDGNGQGGPPDDRGGGN